MKQLFLLALSSLTIMSNVFSWRTRGFMTKEWKKHMQENLEEAIALFDKSIELSQTEYVVYFNRGMAESTMLNNYEGALSDYEQTLKLYPDYKKVT